MPLKNVQFYCIGGGGGGTWVQKNSPYLVWPPFASHSATVRVAGLRQFWGWRCWMWRSCAGVVTHGLRLWGRLDVLPNFNSWATALVDTNHPIHWLASSLCLLSTSKLVCGGRFGTIWLPSHHPGGCCTLVVDAEIIPLTKKSDLST